MSKRTQKLACLIEAIFPHLATRQIAFDLRTNPIDCICGPVVSICEGYARGISIGVQGLDCDDITQICADLTEQVLSDGIDLGEDSGFEQTLYLSIQQHIPIFDEADYCVGYVLECSAVERVREAIALAA